MNLRAGFLYSCPRTPTGGRKVFRFHYERLRRKWPQTQLAALTGINQVYLSLMENGRMTPNEDELQRMACALGISPPSVLMKPVLVEPADVTADAEVQLSGEKQR
jgi:transcriptional regulator with XRE-family HTH domain